MNKNSLYAFYGSLRRGMSNYKLYEDALVYLFSARLKGFKLYSRGQYPCAINANESDSVVVEIFRITDGHFEKQIHELEMSEGYVYQEVLIDGKNIGIYVYESAANFPEVNGGDWVSFFRERVN
jgi:gamma-glutamylcyclotransferase (GGCT)/AIG2-like uncharacterized protein YtfP